MSFKPQVKVRGEDKWHDNGLRFATYEEALYSANDLHGRWMLVVEHRAVESDDPVNYQIKDGVLTSINKPPVT